MLFTWRVEKVFPSQTWHKPIKPFLVSSFPLLWRISVTFMLRPSLPQSWLAKIGEVGYGASWARWALCVLVIISETQIPTEMDWLQQILFGFEWWGWCIKKLQKLHGKLEFGFTVEIHVSHFESRCIWGANALPFLVMHLVVGISVDETFTGINEAAMSPKTNWSFEVVFVIAPQKRRQGIDIDGSIPAGFFLSIFLLAIQASLLYLGWSVFHFRIFTFCQFINMKISPQWFSISRIHNNDLDQRHRFLWVSSSTCNLGLWKFTHANRCQLASETWGYRSDYSDNFYMNQDAEWHASSVLHFALLTAIRWFSTSTTSMIVVPCCFYVSQI